RIGSVPLNANRASIKVSYAYVGSHSIAAIYSGDLNRASASISNILTEGVRGSSKTVLSSSGSPSLIGQRVTFIATVTSEFAQAQNGELVTFFDGMTPLASVPLSSGNAVYTTSSLTGGTHTIRATYAGDATLAPSTGEVRQIVLLCTTPPLVELS